MFTKMLSPPPIWHTSIFENKGLIDTVYISHTPGLEYLAHGTIVRQYGEIICNDGD
jgi:hypothetical protein